MRLTHSTLWISLAAILGWAVFPPGDIALDLGCKPDSLLSRVSATVTGKWFWRRQLNAMVAERDHWLAIQGRILTETGNSASLNESRLSRLTEPEHEEAARRFRLNRIAWTATCAAEIERRLED